MMFYRRTTRNRKKQLNYRLIKSVSYNTQFKFLKKRIDIFNKKLMIILI